MIPISLPLFSLDEEEAIHHVLITGQLAQGKHEETFECCFAEVYHAHEAVAVTSSIMMGGGILTTHSWQLSSSVG